MDIVKLITSYLPSKKLLPYFEKLLETQRAKECRWYFWGNPHVFEAGIFSKHEIASAPTYVIAGNPACSNYIASHWPMFENLETVWRNPGLWGLVKTQTKRSCDLEQLAKNPHPEAIQYLQEIGIPMDPTNPRRTFTKLDFIFHLNGTLSRPLMDSTWANPSAVPFLQQIVANQGTPNYAYLRENPHPWAIGELCKLDYSAFYYHAHFFDLFQNEGIFGTLDFSELQFLLSQIGV